MKLGEAKSGERLDYDTLLAVKLENRDLSEECRRSLEAEKGKEMNSPQSPGRNRALPNCETQV